jgi:hypothetical protein
MRMRDHLGMGTAATALLLLVSGLVSVRPAVAQSGAIQGVVKDGSGSVVAGAIVTLDTAAGAGQRTTVSDDAGAFHFSAVEAGNYKVTITAGGFAVWTAAYVAAGSGESQPPVNAVLQVAPESSTVDVTPPTKEVAAEQLKTEEKQRVLGVFPHYLVTYDPHPAPLDARQKFQLGWKTIVDPVTFVTTGIAAGIQQGRNNYPDFGQGVEGYAKRYGALYANHVSGAMIHHVLLQAVFHQDPRYYFKGTGSFGSRLLYAIGTAFVCKGDNGLWQPDYSDVIGGAAASQISRLYYPYTSRPYLRAWHDVLLGFGGRAEDHLMEQFILSHITTHARRAAAAPQPILREGTAVSLILVEDLSAKKAGDAGPIDFVLASDLQVDGVTVAKVGAEASGRVTYASGTGGDGEAMRVGLDRVRLKVGSAEIPLRSAQVRGGSGALQYHRLEGSGRIAIELYVAQDFMPPAARR